MTEDARYRTIETLGRCVTDASSVTLRFYAFAFDLDPLARPVFEARFNEPKFDPASLQDRMPDEIREIIPSPDKVELWFYDGSEPVVLEAKSVTATWVAYDLEDHVRRIEQLTEWNEMLEHDRGKAQTKDQAGLALVNELLRRAQIKAEASDRLRERQEAAIAVLERLRRHFVER